MPGTPLGIGQVAHPIQEACTHRGPRGALRRSVKAACAHPSVVSCSSRHREQLLARRWLLDGVQIHRSRPIALVACREDGNGDIDATIILKRPVAERSEHSVVLSRWPHTIAVLPFPSREVNASARSGSAVKGSLAIFIGSCE